MDAVHEVFGNLGEQRVGTHDQRTGIHHSTHRVREVHQSGGGVCVVRTHHDRRTVLPRESEDVVPGHETSRDDETRGANLQRERLCAHAVADDERVARPDVSHHRAGLHRPDEHPAGKAGARVADEHTAVEHVGDLGHTHGEALEAEHLGLADIELREYPLVEQAPYSSVRVDDGQGTHAVLAHRAAGGEEVLLAADRNNVLAHRVAYPRANVRNLVGQIHAEPLEDPRGLGRHRPESNRDVDLTGVAHVLQVRVGHRRADGVVVRIAVPEDEDRSHRQPFTVAEGLSPRSSVSERTPQAGSSSHRWRT